MQVTHQIIDGTPEVTIDGQRITRVWGRLDNPGRNACEKLDEYRPTGIQHFLTIADDYYTVGWDGVEDDYGFYEHHLDRLVRSMPEVKLIVFVGIASGVPYRWAKANPSELAVTHDGRPINMPSLASRKWREDFDAALGRFVKHFEASRFADHIMGYNPHRNANEWFAYDMTRRGSAEGVYLDYNPLMADHFRGWLRDAYAGDTQRLREAWKDPRVDFDTAAIPTPAQRRDADHPSMFFADGDHGRRGADWYHCYNQANTADAIACCAAVKAALSEVGSAKLVGVMHGYADVGSMSSVPAEFGHLAADHVATSDAIDFVHAPYAYYNRMPIDGTHLSRYATAGLQQRGKIVLDQFDFGTHHVPEADGAPTRAFAEEMMWRGVAHNLQSNACLYWYEGGPGTYGKPHGCAIWGPMHYDDEQYQKLITDSKALLDENQQAAHRSVAEVALVLSPASVCELTLAKSKAASALHSGYFRVMTMAGIGAPIDEYLLEDFEVIDRPYKLVVFAGCFRIDADLRQRIHDKLRADGATALWVGPGGVIEGAGAATAEAAAATMGISLHRDAGDGWVQVDVTDDTHPLTQGLVSGERAFGNRVDITEYDDRGGFLGPVQDYRFGPAFVADDPAATSLGQLRTQQRPGLVIKPQDGWTSIYSAAPMPPAGLLRNALGHAGGHVYSPVGDLVYANTGFLGLIARGSGPRPVRLPRPMRVTDAISGETLAEKTDAFRVDMHAHGVRLFRLA
jgi:hypothetical protein